MSRRVLASFILVLIAMIAFVEIPLGLQLAKHEREDFQQTANAAAQSLAATAEEHLGDSDERPTAASLHLTIDPRDAVVVADRNGTVIARFGPALPPSEVSRAIAGDTTNIEDRTVAIARVGPRGTDGTILLARSAESLDHRLGALSAALIVAAIGALVLGAVVALALARWIGRPVNGLRRVATEMGAGNLDIRAADVGPPEVRELAADFNVMAERIGGLLDNQRAMTSDVSHQLRTPLAALRLRLENLAAEAPTDLQPDLVATLEEINRLSRLADGLLAVARAEDETPTIEPVPVDAVISERIALWRDLAAERSVQLADHSSAVVAMASPGHLEQILDNLLANALDAVPAGTSIEVEAGREGDQVVVSVVDHGPGMPPELRTEAFQRFSGLGDRSSRSAGLGLAIVGSLAKANHGSVRLDQTRGGGLTVTLLLPVAREQP
jgi:signal transduction histidine kinase